MSSRIWSDKQVAIFDWVQHDTGNLVVEAVAGSGKCLGFGTPVLMYDGSIEQVQNIVAGDILMGDDSTPRYVLSTNVGNDHLYKIIPTKGDSFICNLDHVLTLEGTNRHKGQTIDISLREFLSSYLTDKQWKIVRTGVEFSNEVSLPFPPYLLGVWLGDGDTASQTITTPEPEIESYLLDFANLNGYDVRNVPNNGDEFVRRISLTTSGYFTNNPFRSFVLSCVQAKSKYIPMNYLTANIENRLELLAGLLDTDGYYSGGYYEIITKSPFLVDNILYLARSLGFAAYSKNKWVTLSDWDEPKLYYRITISGDVNKIPCKVQRKQATTRKQIKRVTVTGWKCEYIGTGDYYGFTLTGNGRFLLGDFTITHNTTTAIEALKYLAPGYGATMLAFNKNIAEELKTRLPAGHSASTYNSFGYSIIRKAVGNSVRFDQYKTKNLTEKKLPKDRYRFLQFPVSKLVDLVKANLSNTDYSSLDDLAFTYSIELEDADKQRVYDTVAWVVQQSLQQTNVVDFADQMWLPVMYGWKSDPVDFVIVDELQDTNPAQLAMIQNCIVTDRVMGIGDPRQSIYAFRGADVDAMQKITTALQAKTLPLSVSYRAPLSVVSLVNQEFPDIAFEASPFAIQGTVNDTTPRNFFATVNEGDMILCRTNAPMVKYCFELIRAGKKATIKGRDIGQGLIALIRRLRANDMYDLFTKLEKYKGSEMEKAMVFENTMKAQAVEDKVNTITAISEGCISVPDLIARIERQFSDDAIGITFSTVHKAKGLESQQVYIIEPQLMPHPKAQKMRDVQQESNIKYVAQTRALDTLTFVR